MAVLPSILKLWHLEGTERTFECMHACGIVCKHCGMHHSLYASYSLLVSCSRTYPDMAAEAG